MQVACAECGCELPSERKAGERLTCQVCGVIYTVGPGGELATTVRALDFKLVIGSENAPRVAEPAQFVSEVVFTDRGFADFKRAIERQASEAGLTRFSPPDDLKLAIRYFQSVGCEQVARWLQELYNWRESNTLATELEGDEPGQ